MDRVGSIIWIILLVLGLATSTVSQETIFPPPLRYEINDRSLIQELPPLEWIIEEGEQALSPANLQIGNIEDAQILNLDEGGRLQLETLKSYWYKVILSSKVDLKELKLNIDFQGGNSPTFQTFQNVNAYFFINDSLVNKGISGLGVPFSERDIKTIYTRSLVEFEIAHNSTLEVWIEVASHLSENQVLLISNSIVDPRMDLSDWITPHPSFYVLMGCLFAMLVIGLMLLYWFNEKVYVWFLLFIITTSIPHIIFNFANEMVHFIFPENPLILSKLIAASEILKITMILLFGRVFINTRQYFPKIDQFLLGAIGVFVYFIFIGLFPNFLPPTLEMILGYAGFPALAIIVFCLGYFILSDNKLARFYSVGAILPFLGFVLLPVSGISGFEWLKTLAGYFIGLGPLLALGLALIYRFKIEVEEKLKIEQQSKDLLANQNVLLEKQVKERTSELSNSLENLKATQSQLIQSEKMASLGELTAGIAHEIQNPLNFVNNFSDVSGELLNEMKEELQKGKTDEAVEIIDDLAQNLEKITHHGQRASGIVRGMLDHSRASSGDRILTDVNKLVDEYLRLAYHGLRAKDKSFIAKFETHFDHHLPKIQIAPQEIGRVLLNVINNAFYSVDKKAKSTLSTHKGDDSYQPNVIVSTKNVESPVKDGDKQNHVQITIRDNGDGIPQDIIDKIFQPFFTTKPTGSGTGLGLSLSYDIIQSHGGKMEVQSEEGIGSTFSILLPIHIKW